MKSVLQSPTDEIPTWNTLSGKAVVLEFWATWCGPCVAALPHLNNLVEQFKGRPIEFISVTDEDERHVREFLKFRSVSGIIGLDTDKTMSETYGVHGLPRTVLVGPDGTIQGIVSPEDLNREVLEALLAGRRPEFAKGEQSESTPTPFEDTNPGFFRAVLRPAAETASLSPQTDHSIEGDSWPLKAIIAWAYSIPMSRIFSAAPLPDGHYDFYVQVPYERKDELLTVGQQMLGDTFNLKIHWEIREMDVLVLRGPENDFGPFMRPAAKRAPEKVARGSVSSHGITMAHFAEMLQEELGRIVVDESGLSGYFDLSLYWDPEKPETVMDSMSRELGLRPVVNRRPIKVLLIDHFEVPVLK